MANKMFYTFDEAAQQLDVDESRLEQMVENGEIQQFRDGEKRMFKVAEVDKLAGGGDEAGKQKGQSGDADDTGFDVTEPGDSGAQPAAAGETGGKAPDAGPTGGASSSADTADQSGEIELSDTSFEQDPNTASGSAIPLSETDHGESGGQGSGGQGKAGSQSGMNVLSSDEGGGAAANPAEQTQVTSGESSTGQQGGSGDTSMENVGSGSGLLDLTRESDDTSLGVMFDDLYPGEGEGEGEGGQQTGTGTADTQAGAASSGVMEGMGSAPGTDTSAEETQPGGGTAMSAAAPAAAEATSQAAPEPREEVAADPAGNALGAGFMIGATLALILGLIVTVAGVVGAESPLASAMTASQQSFLLWMGGLLVLTVACGLVGFAIGNAATKGSRRPSRAGR